MRRSKKTRFQSSKKTNGKGLTITLIITSILMTGLVVWVWSNQWDVEKSYTRIGEAIGVLDKDQSKEPKELIPEENENDEKDQDALSKEDEAHEKPVEKKQSKEDAVKYIEGQKLPSEPTYIKEILIANKKHPLPSTFAPGESKEAREAFEELAKEAKKEGFELEAFSTYRSFDYQTELYQRYVDRDGVKEADRYSARPGYSEHQTGLAFDIGEIGRPEDYASERFGETDAGRWIAENAHRFGFIMRYPDGKEFVTGYMYESWHFRYVGKEIAEEIYQKKITLEEFLEL